MVKAVQPSIEELIECALLRPMTPAERWDQAVSFAYGNIALAGEPGGITWDDVVEQAEQLFGPRPDDSLPYVEEEDDDETEENVEDDSTCTSSKGTAEIVIPAIKGMIPIDAAITAVKIVLNEFIANTMQLGIDKQLFENADDCAAFSEALSLTISQIGVNDPGGEVESPSNYLVNGSLRPPPPEGAVDQVYCYIGDLIDEEIAADFSPEIVAQRVIGKMIILSCEIAEVLSGELTTEDEEFSPRLSVGLSHIKAAAYAYATAGENLLEDGSKNDVAVDEEEDTPVEEETDTQEEVAGEDAPQTVSPIIDVEDLRKLPPEHAAARIALRAITDAAGGLVTQSGEVYNETDLNERLISRILYFQSVIAHAPDDVGDTDGTEAKNKYIIDQRQRVLGIFDPAWVYVEDYLDEASYADLMLQSEKNPDQIAIISEDTVNESHYVQYFRNERLAEIIPLSNFKSVKEEGA